MREDFDKTIDRSNTYSIKYNTISRGKPKNVLPLWVADMDFQTPNCVITALEEHSRHGIFGYSDTDEAYFRTLQNWFLRRFNWSIEKDWLIKTPGVVTAIHIAIRALTQKGDSVIIQQPVYYPFSSAVKRTGRTLIVNELLYQNGGYTIDFDGFEQKIKENKVKLFILCNPHNPVGRVWEREELIRLGDICLDNGVIVVSDEIHQDFVYEGHEHLVFSTLTPAYQDITITCTAPSKSFNLAGMQLSNIFIANEQIRKLFLREYACCGLSQPGVMGIVACRAAYECGEVWLNELITYLAGNLVYLKNFLKERIPKITLVEPEGTYLVWLDFRAFGFDDEKLNDVILNKAGLWLDGGGMFGPSGAGFQRVNVACPQSVLSQALQRLEKVFV